MPIIDNINLTIINFFISNRTSSAKPIINMTVPIISIKLIIEKLLKKSLRKVCRLNDGSSFFSRSRIKQFVLPQYLHSSLLRLGGIVEKPIIIGHVVDLQFEHCFAFTSCGGSPVTEHLLHGFIINFSLKNK